MSHAFIDAPVPRVGGIRCFPLAAVFVSVAVGCAPAGEPSPGPAVATEFLYERSGGLCPDPDGGGAVCALTIVVGDEGTWRAMGAPSPTPSQGAVRTGAASALAAIVDGGWDALTAQPFTDMCPTAYDGSEISYTVRRLPESPLADADIRQVRSCVHDWSHLSARAVLLRLDGLWQELDLPER